MAADSPAAGIPAVRHNFDHIDLQSSARIANIGLQVVFASYNIVVMGHSRHRVGNSALAETIVLPVEMIVLLVEMCLHLVRNYCPVPPDLCSDFAASAGISSRLALRGHPPKNRGLTYWRAKRWMGGGVWKRGSRGGRG